MKCNRVWLRNQCYGGRWSKGHRFCKVIGFQVVAVCPLYDLAQWEAVNREYGKKGNWERVRQGRVEGLHMLASLQGPHNNTGSLVVDFRQIYSLPIGYLKIMQGD